LIPNSRPPPPHHHHQIDRKVIAIVSDYDGTLVPTAAIRSRDGKTKLPDRLEKLLSTIACRIPVCILSSKDYWFLQDKVSFANTISCILGIETLVFNRDPHSLSSASGSLSPAANQIISRHLLVNNEDLLGIKDRALNRLAEEVSSQLPEIDVERKYTRDGLLAGITFDWRYQTEDWSKYSNVVPAYVRKMVSLAADNPSATLYLQTYSAHPFVDVYAVKCDKGMGFDCIIEELSFHSTQGSILYLGDSENDNPAFEKAGISVGVISDERLDSGQLKCDYLVKYDQLPDFLELLMDNDFVFSTSVVEAAKPILRRVKDRTETETIGESEKHR
jgi:HAD superfamily hydrolase (TIGR01484 family)